jgi:hypothetical protein
MKVRKLIRKLFRAIIQHDQDRQRRLYAKLTKKSLDHKHTQAVQ